MDADVSSHPTDDAVLRDMNAEWVETTEGWSNEIDAPVALTNAYND